MDYGKPLDIKRNAFDDGWEYDGSHYETKTGAIYFGLMGFCGCGSPEDAVALVHDCLNGPPRAYKPDVASPLSFEAVVDNIKADPERAAWFIMYALDAWEMTEHGGSVGGSWLTDRGKQAIEVFAADGCNPDGQDAP